LIHFTTIPKKEKEKKRKKESIKRENKNVN